MKQLLLVFIFIFNVFSGQISAQSFQENSVDVVSVSAYPNPTKDFLYLKTSNPNTRIKTVTFYSILGNTVAEIIINSSFSEIRLDRLKPGKYFMKYTLSNNTQKIIQIIKQ